MDQHKIVKLVAVAIGSVIGVFIMVIGFQMFQSIFSRASDETPRDVVVSEIAQNSVKVTWSTANTTQGVIEYGTSPTALNFFAPESQKGTSHSVDLTLLSSGTTYYFQIRIGDQKYDNGGVPWTLTTKGGEKTQTQPVVPTATPVATTPTPYVTLAIPQAGEATTAPAASCNETNCDNIKEKLGKGCTTQDYLKCKDKK